MDAMAQSSRDVPLTRTMLQLAGRHQQKLVVLRRADGCDGGEREGSDGRVDACTDAEDARAAI